MKEPSEQIFKGLQILDLTRVMSGPFCTAMMADLGADIIKIEMPDFGEEGRHFAPHIDGESTYFALLNRGKQSVTINLKSPEGIALIKELASKADVLVENFRPGVMERLGLGAVEMQAANPRLIYASISGFGQQGPYADWPAFDLVIQAMSGLMSVTGESGGRATAVGESVADVATGMFAAWGIAAALYDRERSGKGRHLEVAMLDSVFSMLLTSLSRRLYTDRPSGRVGNRHPETYPVDSFATASGDIVIVGFSDGIFQGICKAMGRPELAQDARFLTNKARNEHEQELREIIGTWAAGLKQDQALDALRARQVPSGPVWSVDDILGSPHAAARGLVQPGVNSKLGAISHVPQPVKFSGTKIRSGLCSPTLGEHTESVLRDKLGLDEAQILALRSSKAI